MTDSTLHPEQLDGLGKKLFSKTVVIFLICLAFSWLPDILDLLYVEIDTEFTDSFIVHMTSYGLFALFGWLGYNIAVGQTSRFNKLLGLENLGAREFKYRRTFIGMQIMGAAIILGSVVHILTNPDNSFNIIMTTACGSIITVGSQTSHELNPVVRTVDPILHLNSIVKGLVAFPIVSYVVLIYYSSILEVIPDDIFGGYDYLSNAFIALCGIFAIAAIIISMIETIRVSNILRGTFKNLTETSSKNEVVKALTSLLLIMFCEFAMILGYFFTADKTILQIFVPATILITLYIKSTVQADNPHANLDQTSDFHRQRSRRMNK